MVAWRLDRRLRGRVDPSDVLQEVYIDAAQRAPDYLNKPDNTGTKKRAKDELWKKLVAEEKALIE